MKHYLATAILLTASLGTLAAEQLNILFMGNSFTTRHELPLLVKEVLEEGQPDLTIHPEWIAYGGQDMFRHHDFYFSETSVRLNTITVPEIEEKIAIMQSYLDAGETPDSYNAYWEKTGLNPVDWPIVAETMQTALQNQQKLIDRINRDDRIKWDYLVLQSWKDVVDDVDAGYGEYVQKWAQLAQQEGIKVILYITAPQQQNAYPVTGPVNPAQTQRELTTVRQLMERIQPYAVVPVPLAINNIQRNGTELKFRYVNDMHPNQYTAFLTANTFYAAISGESPEGLAFNKVTENKQIEPGKDPDGNDATVVFDEATKVYLQRTAFETVRAFNDGEGISWDWRGLPVEPVGGFNFVNTDAPLGYLEISQSPWLYSYGLNHWIFIPGESAPTNSLWLYLFL